MVSSATPSQKNDSEFLASEPLKPGEVKPDKPLPAEDVKPKPTTRPVGNGCLSKSQILTMRDILQEARKTAIRGKLKEALDKFDEFAGGLWDEAAHGLKIKSPKLHGDINARIKKIDDITRKFSITKTRQHKQLRIKFIKEVTNLINAIDPAGGCSI
jgi:hypothetical protein